MTAAELRSWARRATDPRAGSRAFAIANALEGMTRADAARLAGMERQALLDAVVRYNAEGLNGLRVSPSSGAVASERGQQAALRALILIRFCSSKSLRERGSASSLRGLVEMGPSTAANEKRDPPTAWACRR